MKFAIYQAATGQILRTIDCGLEEQAVLNCAAGELLVPVLPEVRDDTHYIVDGAPVVLPAKPAGEHNFDWANKTWRADLVAMKAAKNRQINTERERRIYAQVIVYDGKNVDADAKAQRNISEKLNDISRREQEGVPMPAEMLMWRDADNINHVFADQASYRSWLNGLAIALGLRGTQAYAWSWAKKAEVDASTTPEQLAAIVV